MDQNLIAFTTQWQYSSAGAVPKLVEILASYIATKAHTHTSPSLTCTASDGDLVIQAAAALGSFACGSPESMDAVLQAGAVPRLIELIHSKDMNVVEAGVCVCMFVWVHVCVSTNMHAHVCLNTLVCAHANV